MKKTLVIWHDNGVKGSEGFSDYTMEEVINEGGIEVILNNYKKAGITVLDWYYIGWNPLKSLWKLRRNAHKKGVGIIS